VLPRLSDEGRRLLTVGFLRGERELWPTTVSEPYVRETTTSPLESGNPERTEALLTEFDDVVDEALERFPTRTPTLDAWLGPRLRTTLSISRRTAAEPAVWRYLAILRRPQLVRHRWGYAGRAMTASRYWKPGMRPTSNTLGRLWWISELLRGPWPADTPVPALDEGVEAPGDLHDDPWAVARVALATPILVVPLFVRTMADYSPLARAATIELHDASGALIESVMPELRARLSLLQLESHDEHALRGLVRELRDKCQRYT